MAYAGYGLQDDLNAGVRFGFSVLFRYGEACRFLDADARETGFSKFSIERVDAASRDHGVVVGGAGIRRIAGPCEHDGLAAEKVGEMADHVLRPVGGFVVAGEDPFGDRMVVEGAGYGSSERVVLELVGVRSIDDDDASVLLGEQGLERLAGLDRVSPAERIVGGAASGMGVDDTRSGYELPATAVLVE